MLKIYTSANPDAALSNEGAFSNPLAITFDGVNGGKIERKLYLRNTDISKSYTNITVQPYDDPEAIVAITGGINGFAWKLFAGDQRPLEEQWDMVDAGDPISLVDIDDTTTYLPFWFRIEVPAGAPVSSFKSASLQVSCDESP